MQDKTMQDILKNFLSAGEAKMPVRECGDMDQGGVTLKTSSAGEMADILRALAGVGSSDKPAMPPMPPMGMDEPTDAPMPMKLPMVAPEKDMDMDMDAEDAAIEDYDNEPEEEYMDVDDVIPSGDDLHRKKPMAAMRVKDPAVATESIKDRLWAALNEKKSK
jgi:hypothetical protein